MTTVVPSRAYIDSLVQSIREAGEVEYAKLCELLFAIISLFCAQPPPQTGPGRRKTYSDSTILKLDMLMHLTSKRGETEILREAKRHYAQYFDQLPGQGRLWHRIRQAVPLVLTQPTGCRVRRLTGIRQLTHSGSATHLAAGPRQWL